MNDGREILLSNVSDTRDNYEYLINNILNEKVIIVEESSVYEDYVQKVKGTVYDLNSLCINDLLDGYAVPPDIVAEIPVKQSENKSSGSNMSPNEIFEKCSPAVFKIYTSTGTQDFQGSGFFISSDGIAVSNYHVFEGTAVGYESIMLSDGSICKVSKIYHKSKEEDFIIFRVNIKPSVPYIPLSDTQPKIGEKIYTIGSPYGLDNTFSSGEISQIRNNGKLFQISAPIDHGSSGGVLLNSSGEAVGITSGGFDESGANLNFAININILKPFIFK